MSNSADKKNGKKNGKKEKKRARDESGARPQGRRRAKSAPKGRLVALEGARGRDLQDATERLSRLLRDGDGDAGWSGWDASNTFYELRLGKAKKLFAPPKSLVLLYASDLMFRLRWEIDPALAEGRTVIAAPYVQTAIAFGMAVGLDKDWLEELFSFAPAADVKLRIKEKPKLKDSAKKKANGKEKRPKSAAGFVDFCCGSLAASSSEWNSSELRAAVLKGLEAMEERGELRRFGKKLPKETAENR
ncbi:MAG TPA: hypothetical protein VGF59_17480 [Bryobacteraceae bacterium]|jgi:hypothetical protein